MTPRRALCQNARKMPTTDSRVRDVLARALRAFDVDTVFGLIGRANMPFISAVIEHGIRYLSARHENAVVAMADGYARTTGRLGVCTVTLGPGVTNGLTAVVEASKARTSMLVITGDAPLVRSSDDQFVDQPLVFGSLDVPVMPVRSARTALDDIAGAVATATATLRPVVVPVRLDVLEQPCAVDLSTLRPFRRQAVGPRPEDVSRIADAVVQSERPVILAGRGASRARDDIVALADRMGALVATTMHASGLFDGYPFAVGTAGVHGTPLSVELFSKADLVLAFGTSLNRFTTRAGHLFRNVRSIIRCDVDPICAVRPPASDGLVGDASACAQAVLGELAARGFACRGFHVDSVRDRVKSNRASGGRQPDTSGRLRDPRSVLEWLDGTLPRDRSVVCDTGHGCGYALECLAVHEYGRGVHPYFFQSIGLALGMAGGVAAGRTGTVVVAVVGDGALLMTLGELETLARHRLPVLVLVMNDAAYGAEVRELEQRGEAVDVATFPDTDFAAVGAALGATAFTVRTLDDLESVRAWIDSPCGPCLLDCKLDATAPAEWFVDAIGGPQAYLRNPLPGF